MFNLIKYKNYFIGFSTVLTLLAVLSIGVLGFRTGIDFSGGTLWQIKFIEKPVSVSDLEKEGFPATFSESTFLLRLKDLSEAEHQAHKEKLQSVFGPLEELRFESIGPSIGKELRSKAITAFVLVLLGISLYIAFAFRKVSHPVSSWKYGLVTLITLFHDALIPAGLYSLLSRFLGIEADTNLVVALLVVMGFSVHDTIVVFDRIRENLIVQKGKSLAEIINISINQTFARSVNTSLTLVLVLIALYIFGAGVLNYFVLTILVGTIIGTYSSIFVASPLLTYFQRS